MPLHIDIHSRDSFRVFHIQRIVDSWLSIIFCNLVIVPYDICTSLSANRGRHTVSRTQIFYASTLMLSYITAPSRIPLKSQHQGLNHCFECLAATNMFLRYCTSVLDCMANSSTGSLDEECISLLEKPPKTQINKN